jgi:hypothetical protein
MIGLPRERLSPQKGVRSGFDVTEYSKRDTSVKLKIDSNNQVFASEIYKEIWHSSLILALLSRSASNNRLLSPQKGCALSRADSNTWGIMQIEYQAFHFIVSPGFLTGLCLTI